MTIITALWCRLLEGSGQTFGSMRQNNRRLLALFSARIALRFVGVGHNHSVDYGQG